MQMLGCIAMLFVVLCMLAFFVVMTFWLVVGTIIFLAKLLVWMAYAGAFFIVIVLLAALLSRLWSAITR